MGRLFRTLQGLIDRFTIEDVAREAMQRKK
jgi:hypothetical protein